MDDERRTPASGAPERSKGDTPRPPAAFARFEALGTFGALGTVGLSFVLSLVIGTALGLWLDRLTGWSPLFFIVFFLLGLAAGIRSIYITTKKFMR